MELMVANGLDRTSTVTDIQFLPLSSNHAGNNILSSDRVILLMGDLKLPGFGNASAVLYDGSSYQPYILATRTDGSNGIIHGLFSEQTESFSSQGTPPKSLKLIFRPHSIRLDHCHRIGHFPLLNPAARYRGINRRTYPSRKRRLRSSSRDSSHPRSKPRTRPSIATNRQLRRTSSGGISVISSNSRYNKSLRAVAN